MHPKYWKRPRIMAPFESEGSTGGGESLADAFAAHFDSSAQADDDQQATAPTTESTEDAAARLASEEAAAQSGDKQPANQQSEAPADSIDQPQKFTVQVDGKPVELSADEVAEHVKNGMRQADPARAAAPTATISPAPQQGEATAQRDQQAAQVEALAAQAAIEVKMLKGQLTDELLQSNPTHFLRIKNAVEAREEQIQQAHQFLHQVGTQRQQEQAETVRAHLEKQHTALIEKLPDWKDPAKAKVESDQIKSYLTKEGFRPEELSITDHRAVILAQKAMKYDALMARVKATQTQVAAAPTKVARTGTPAVAPTDGRTAAMRELAQTGSRDAAARVFADLYG